MSVACPPLPQIRNATPESVPHPLLADVVTNPVIVADSIIHTNTCTTHPTLLPQDDVIVEPISHTITCLAGPVIHTFT